MNTEDFNKIAESLADLTANDYRLDKIDKAELVASVLAKASPLFDRIEFLTACGVEPDFSKR